MPGSIDGEKTTFDRSILSSTYINFLFGAGVNGTALPQLNGFTKTLDVIKRVGGDISKGFEAAVDDVENATGRTSIHNAFIKEFKEFHDNIDFKSDPVRHIEQMLRITYQFVRNTQNRNPGMKQINIYTLNYDEIMQRTLEKLGYIYHCISSSNTNSKSSLVNVIGYDYTTKKYVPSFMISQLHGGIDNPIIPGKEKYKAVLNAEYFEIAFNMKQHLSRSNSILIVIGYSGGDDHINEIIRDCMYTGLTVYWYRYSESATLPTILDQSQIHIIDQPDASDKKDSTYLYYEDVKRVWEEKSEE